MSRAKALSREGGGVRGSVIKLLQKASRLEQNAARVGHMGTFLKVFTGPQLTATVPEHVYLWRATLVSPRSAAEYGITAVVVTMALVTAVKELMDENPYEAPQTKELKRDDDFSAEKVSRDAAISVVKWNLVLVVSAFCCKFLQVNSGDFEESLFGHAAAICTFAFLVVWPISGVFIIATRQSKAAPLPIRTGVVVGALSVFWLMVVVTLVNFLSI